MRYKSWNPIYDGLWLVPLYPNSKNAVYNPPVDPNTKEIRSDPVNLHAEFKTERDYFLRESTNDFVLHCWKDYGYGIGVLTGRQRNGKFLVVEDFDVDRKLGLSIEDARAWRNKRFDELREWKTRMTLTVSGGFHAWFYGSSDHVHAYVRRISAEQPTYWLSVREKSRAEGGMVVVPPTKLPWGQYKFLDGDKVPILDVSNEPVPTSPLKLDSVAEFLSFFDSRRKL